MYYQIFTRTSPKFRYSPYGTYADWDAAIEAIQRLDENRIASYIKTVHVDLVKPYAIQHDVTGKVIWMGDAADSQHAIEQMRQQLQNSIPDGYLLVTCIDKATVHAIKRLGDDTLAIARLLDQHAISQ